MNLDLQILDFFGKCPTWLQRFWHIWVVIHKCTLIPGCKTCPRVLDLISPPHAMANADPQHTKCRNWRSLGLCLNAHICTSRWGRQENSQGFQPVRLQDYIIASLLPSLFLSTWLEVPVETQQLSTDCWCAFSACSRPFMHLVYMNIFMNKTWNKRSLSGWGMGIEVSATAVSELFFYEKEMAERRKWEARAFHTSKG